MYFCKFCNKSLSSNNSLNRHLEICKQKIIYINDQTKQEQNLQLVQLKNEVKTLKVEHSKEVEALEEKLKLMSEQNNELHIQLKLLEQKLELTTHFIKTSSDEKVHYIQEYNHEKVHYIQEYNEKNNQVVKTSCDEKVEFMKAFLPKSLKLKSNLTSEDNDAEDEKDNTSNVTNINGHNVYVTQNQFFIEKINNLPPINDVLQNIVNDETLYDKVTGDFENFPKFVSTEIAKCVLVKNFKKLLGVYRMKDENNEIKTLVDPIDKISKDFYNNPIFSQKIEEIYTEYDRNTPTGDDTELLELNNSINLFRLLLNPEIVTNKNKEQLIKTSQDVILKQAKPLRS